MTRENGLEQGATPDAMEQAARCVLQGGEAFLTTRIPWGDHGVFYTGEALEACVGPVALRDLPCLTADGAVFVERFCPAAELVILGGGHISVPLCAMAALAGLHVTVIDDREEYANPMRFPQATRVLCGGFEQILTQERFSAGAFFAILTRGHASDTACLARVLTLPRRYVGMIGSRRKVAQAMAEMRAAGFDEETLARVYAPIGLEIHAQTPAEIAVSILAQVIDVMRAPGEGAGMDEAIAAAIAQGQARGGKLLTIVEKRGSAPRAAGTRMLVLPDGKTLGTIGGGSAEYACLRRAMERMGKAGCEVLELEVEDVGMTCGGTIKVLLEAL